MEGEYKHSIQKVHNKEYLIKNACYSVTKYYLCKQNNKRSLLGRKQRSQVVRSFPNRYQFSCTNKVTSLFSDRYIFIIILHGKNHTFTRRICNTQITNTLRTLRECVSNGLQMHVEYRYTGTINRSPTAADNLPIMLLTDCNNTTFKTQKQPPF